MCRELHEITTTTNNHIAELTYQ